MYQIDDITNKLICGDNKIELPKIPSECIDLILTDPPYNVKKDYGIYKDNLPEKQYWKDLEFMISEMVRVLKPRGSLYMFMSQNNKWHLKNILEKYLRFNRELIWYHPNNMSNIYGCWFRSYEPFLFCSKGPAYRLNNVFPDNAYDVLIYAGTQRNYKEDRKLHITQKPIKLMKKIIAAASRSGDLILDPWSGSGTTCVAAKMHGRKYIGIEINPDYCQLARKRLKTTKLEIKFDHGEIFHKEE